MVRVSRPILEIFELPRMRALLVTDRFPPDRGGVAVSAARLARSLELDVVRLTSQLPPGMVDFEAPVYRVGRAAQDDESLQLLERVLLTLVQKEGYQLLHAFFAGKAGYAATMAAKLAGVPSLVSLRGNDLDRTPYRPAHAHWLEGCLKRADRITCVSREQQFKLERLWGRKDGVYIPNAVDGDAFFPVPVTRNGKVVLASGEMRFKKGLSVLQNLLEEWDESGAERRLVLLGGVRKEEAAGLQAWCRAHPGPAQRLEVRPYVSDPAALREAYCQADLVVHPALWEGMPNALLEAMACQRPVLATCVGGVQDLVLHTHTGWLLAPEEAHELAERIEECLAAPDTGKAARKYVLKHHSPAAEARSYRALYKEMLARKRATAASKPAREKRSATETRA